MTSRKILMAMSGGVDSSVAAYILLRDGCEVLGATMCMHERYTKSAVPEAQAVCRQLNIEHVVVDITDEFERLVVRPFLADYLTGRTPNPCIRCNKLFKFGRLLEVAREHGCDAVATGHYARLVETDNRWRLLRGTDRRKEQSYFLFLLAQEQMNRVLFPLGDMTKDRVRAVAAERQLVVAQRPESQEICFVPGDDLPRFFAAETDAQPRPGEIVDESGRVLGRHRGIHHYTVGQRRGMGVAAAEPLYVLAIDAATDRLIVGPKGSLARIAGRVGELHWCAGRAPAESPLKTHVQIRYRHNGVEADIHVSGDRAELYFHEPVYGWTPGQAAVFYRDDEVIGGGWIEND